MNGAERRNEEALGVLRSKMVNAPSCEFLQSHQPGFLQLQTLKEFPASESAAVCWTPRLTSCEPSRFFAANALLVARQLPLSPFFFVKIQTQLKTNIKQILLEEHIA